jgi:hypothetical protein
MTEMLFESKYSSVVSAGMPLGISLNEFREQRTTVPIMVAINVFNNHLNNN